VQAGQAIEDVIGRIAANLVGHGIGHPVVAGGETSGEVARAHGIRSLVVGREIDPGVPFTMSLTGPPVTLVFKSGNFGSPSFFTKALVEGGC
jgi:3-dehydrotetronate 4-kinase